MEETFEAVRYAADGHAGEPGDGDIIATGSLEECRAEIQRRTIAGALRGNTWSGSLLSLCWSGTDDDIEAYHESDEEGCGGWAIRRA